MKAIKKKIILWLMVMMILFSMMPPEITDANTVIGSPGTIPRGGSSGLGGGIINLEHPTFVVGIVKETFAGETEIKLPITRAQLEDKVKLQFKNHMPYNESSIFFAPSGSYSYKSSSAIAWTNVSNGSLNYIKGGGSADSLYDYRLRPIGTGNGDHLWYDQLMAAIPAGGDKGALSGFKWKTIASGQDKTAQALAVWSKILEKDGKNIRINLGDFILTDENANTQLNKNKKACAWVDMMISLWQLSPPGAAKKAYEDEIERFLKESNLTTNLPLISISTAVLIRAPKHNPQYLFIKSVDYIHFIAGIAPEASMYLKNASSRSEKDYSKSSYKNLILDATKESLKILPKVERTTDFTGEAIKNDAFNWGMSGVMSCRISTATGSAVLSDSSVDGAIPTLTFNGGMSGFVVAYPNFFGAKVKGRFSIKANPDENVTLKVKSTVIGQPVDVTLEMEQKGDDLTTWKTRLAQTITEGFPKISIDLKRQIPSGSTRQADKTSPGETDKNPFLRTSSKWKGDGSWIQISVEELLNFIEGKAKVVYRDNTISYPIEAKSSVEFDYSATVKIQLSNAADDLITLTPEVATTKKIFNNPPIPPEPKSATIITQPSYWSEIKNGSPGNEPFEAMAGVPTTRNLYFASGGSEFIVEAEIEYVQDTEITRTYRSYFSGVDSEFKAGDTAPSMTLGGQSANMHGGGTYTKTWTGSIPNKASAVTVSGSGTVTATCPAQPDRTAYNAAKSEATTFANSVNSTTLTFTSASDKLTRSKSGWSAGITTDSPVDPQTTSDTKSAYHSVTSGNPPVTVQVPDPVTATAQPGGAGSYTITVTWTVPPHIICGPQCCRVLPQVEDSWTQKIKFDHVKITQARVWKLDKAAVDGMSEITGTDEFKATIVQGDPNIFHNISQQNKSIDGRLRYSVESNQHDTVTWYEGPRSSKDDGIVSQRQNVSPVAGNGHQNSWATGILYNNPGYTNEKDYHRNRGGVSTATNNVADTKDVSTMEWSKFNERRTTINEATVISDFLILQTSSGDQSIIYFQKDAIPKQTQENYDKVAASWEEMFDNNPLSFSKMDPTDINIGSYNGKYYTPLSKYSAYKNAPIATKFDTIPAGLVRPARPSSAMRLVNTNIDIIDTKPNGYYTTGTASVFYKNILNVGGPPFVYSLSYNTHFGANGREFTPSNYSDNHSKVNDIVIHNPVSAEFSMVIPLAGSRDQRTPASQVIGGNLQGPTMESVKRLKNPLPKQNLIWNGDAENVDTLGKISNWKTVESVAGKATFTKTTDAAYKIGGNTSFEIITQPNANYQGIYYTDVPAIPGDSYTFTGKMRAYRVKGYFEIQALNSAGGILQTYKSAEVTTSAVQTLSINLTAPAAAATLRIRIVNGNTSGYVAGNDEYVFADDLVLYDNSTTSWQSMAYEINEYINVPNPNYITPYEIPNPDYIPANPGANITYNFTGDIQTFTAPATGMYTLELWGAQGGSGSGGYGGYSKGTINLNKNETLYIYVGGSNGWNGGGSGHGRASDVGGGGTDIRKDGQTLYNRIIVAGGGGGSGPAAGGEGGGATGNAGTNRCGSGGGGGTQTYGGYGGSNNGGSGSFGQGGSNNAGGSSGGGGGGGGWYGGGAGGNDYSNYNDYDDSGGGGGSGYIGGVSNGTMSVGTNAGNGKVKITAPATAAVGSPTILVNNRNYIPAVLGAGETTTYNFTGGVQSYTAQKPGPYTFEVWGAQGGSMGSGTGGNGGYAKGTLTLSQGEALSLYVGGQPYGANAGGWNGGGASSLASGGGGASDIRRGGTALSNRIIVAGGGGGGGSDNSSETHNGGTGGGTTGGSGTVGTGGTQTSGGGGDYAGSLGQGASGNSHGTAGGGGYYGGGGGSSCSRSGGGGSGYVGTLTDTTMSNGVRSGHGMIKITSPGITSPAVGVPWIEGLSPTIEVIQPVTHTITTAPDDWYENVIVTIPAAQPVAIPGGGTYVPGNFINLDYGFQIYFPNKGNFYGDSSYGISNVTAMRGKGFTDNMDTTEWTKEKYVQFEFNVIHNGTVYGAGQDIPLDIYDGDSIYDFYCPLANYEAISAEVVFKVIANNGGGVDNDYPANKQRYGYLDAKHSGVRRFNVDVVGRIGNLIMEDTGDFRFANLFKVPKSPVSWIITNVVKDIDPTQQNRILGSRTDVRGEALSASRDWLNTYGLLSFADKDPIAFPLTPDKNNIAALRKQPKRPGYKSLLDIQTIGDYSNGTVQVIPYYYWLDLNNGTIKQADIYMDVNGAYKPINKFGAAIPGWDPGTVYNNLMMLNWDDEFERRNYTAGERAKTEEIASIYQIYDIAGNLIDLPTPMGKYHAYGNSQIMTLNGRNRTFIGTSAVNGMNTNPGNVLSDDLFGRQAQRWHFSTGLPSSAVAVERGKAASQANIDILKNNNAVLLMALDIKSAGQTFVLQYTDPTINNNVIISGKSYNLSAIPYPVTEVVSVTKSSANDLDTVGTH